MPLACEDIWSQPRDLPREPIVWRTLVKISRRKWLTLLVITDDSHRWPVSRASQHCIRRLMFWLDIIPVMGTSTLYLKRGERDCIRSMLRLRRVLSAAVNKHNILMLWCYAQLTMWVCGLLVGTFVCTVCIEFGWAESLCWIRYGKGGKLYRASALGAGFGGMKERISIGNL